MAGFTLKNAIKSKFTNDITDKDIETIPSRTASQLYNEKEEVQQKCKILISYEDGVKLRNSIISENTIALSLYTGAINKLNDDIVTNSHKPYREINVNNVKKLVELKDKTIDNGKKQFLKAIGNVRSIETLNIEGTLKVKSYKKMNVSKEVIDSEEHKCKLTKIDPVNNIIYFILLETTAKNGSSEHSIKTDYLCIKEQEHIKSKNTISSKSKIPNSKNMSSSEIKNSPIKPKPKSMNSPR